MANKIRRFLCPLPPVEGENEFKDVGGNDTEVVINEISQLLDHIRQGEPATVQDRQWPDCLSELLTFLLTGQNNDNSPGLQTFNEALNVAQKILEKIGNASLVTAGFHVISYGLKKVQDIYKHKQECLSVLEEMNFLNKVVKQCTERETLKEGMQAEIKAATELIMEGTLMCLTQLKSSPFSRLEMAKATTYISGSSPLNRSASVLSSGQVSLYSHNDFRPPGFLASGLFGANRYNDREFKNICFGKKSLGKQCLPSFKFTIQASDTSGTLISTPTDQSPPATEKRDSHVRVVNITNDTLGLRACSYERLKFEVEYGLKKGTTDNSYIIKGPTEMALIDVPDQAFTKEYVRILMSTEDVHLLKSLIIGHLSPKRIDSVIAIGESLAHKSLPLDVYCSNPAAQLLSASIPENLQDAFSLKVVRAGDRLDLGGGHKLQFILTPTPRWPDAMCTYDPATQLMFTQKFFSAHVCSDNDFDIGGWEVYGEDWRFFYDCMLSPAAQQADAALKKLPIVAQFAKPSYTGKTGIDIVKTDVKYILSTMLSSLNLPMGISTAVSDPLRTGVFVTAAICPIHGPIVRYTLTELVREYNDWTNQRLRQTDETTIAVIYASAYGNTAALAQAISRGISKAGIGVETLNCELSTDEEVVSLVRRCNGFVIGSPTLAGHMPTPIQKALGIILNDNEARPKPCGVFGSFGWSGEAVDEIEQRLKDAGFSFSFPTVRCKFKPTEGMLQICEESGTDIAQAVRKSKLRQRRDSSKFVMASNVDQAVGRVIGSLCVVSAINGDAESAMVASWVSQASFVPPGITLAVAKDRAVESLILPGSKFILNVLGEGKSSAIMKQLLKPFKPGEPRFEGLKTKEASSGGRILLDAISWMECTVKSRMESGDHWVLYATVVDGQLQDDKTVTALHYRKTGTRY